MKLLFLLGITLSLFAAPPWLDAPKSFEQFEKLLAGNGRTSDLFGYSVAISGDTAVVGSYFHEEGSALNTGAAYIFTFDAQSGTFVQQAMLSASDFRDGDSFGFSVAISGDTVVVGSYRHGPVITRAGAAYVFVKPQGGWSDMNETAKLTASDAVTVDELGYSVAVSGDVVAAGSHLDDDKGTSSGSVYLYEKPQNGWVDMNESAKITASDGMSNDRFGDVLAFEGSTLAVSAPYDDDGGVNSGSIYLFEHTAPGVYTQSTKLATAMPSLYPTPAAEGHCGASLALSPKYLVAGCPGSGAVADGAGTAFVFEKSGAAWSNLPPVARLSASDAAVSDAFGSSVAVEADTIAVGASNADGSAVDTGAVYIFEQANSYSQSAKLLASDGAQNDAFGISAAMRGGMLLVGSYHDADKGYNSGSAYIFAQSVSFNTPENKTAIIDVAADDAEGDAIGFGIAGGADAAYFEANGGMLSFLSAPDYEAPADSGADNVYDFFYALTDSTGERSIYPVSVRVGNIIFEGASPKAESFEAPQSLQADAPQAFQLFGRQVAVNDKIALVAAPYENSTGAVYLYEYSGGSYLRRAKLTPSDPLVSRFGSVIDISGDTVVVGAEGVISVFEKPQAGWSDMHEDAILTLSQGSSSNEFGTSSIAMDGDTIVAGAAADNTSGTNCGAAYIFEKPSAGGWVDANESAWLYAGDAQDFDRFGSSVAIGANLVAVASSGSSSDDEKVYLYEKPHHHWIDTAQQAILRPSGMSQDAEFGASVLIEGDTVIVGAPYRVFDGVDSGGVYLFEKPLQGWQNSVENAILHLSNPAAGSEFGQSIALSGDLMLIGASGVNGQAGSVFLFSKGTQGWTNATEAASFSAPAGAANNEFGHDVALYGSAMIVGEPLGDTGVENGGSAYIYKAKNANRLSTPILMYLLN